jgi:hypothetical protein
MRVKRINVYLYSPLYGDESLYCPFCGKEIDLRRYFKEEPCEHVELCEHVVFIARRLSVELEYYVDELLAQRLLEMLEREPWRGDDLLFVYISDKYREVYERVYGKPPTCTQEDYVERGSIKIEDAINLLKKSSFWSKSDIILFKVLVRVPSSGHGPGYEYVEFIALLKEGF